MCTNKTCKAYDENYEYNCKINVFTFAIGCKSYQQEENSFTSIEEQEAHFELTKAAGRITAIGGIGSE